MAFAHSALHDDGKEINRADECDIDDQSLSQSADRRMLRPWRGVWSAKECESDREAEQQRHGNENGPDRHVDAEYRAADIFVTGARDDIQRTEITSNRIEKMRLIPVPCSELPERNC